jgi:hypothetical protein
MVTVAYYTTTAKESKLSLSNIYYLNVVILKAFG